MGKRKKRQRGIGPARDKRWSFSTTSEIEARIKALADKHGWTVSKTLHLVAVRGIDVLEAELEVDK